MPKSVYSLILNDEVVTAVDRAAYQQGTNRSNFVNQILAEYVSYVTPEKRMQDIFQRMEDLLNGKETFQVLLRTSAAQLSLRSALAYKYNPTVRYSVELYHAALPAVGELKVALRTQNSSLILYMLQFCKLWARVEQSYLDLVEYDMADGRFQRRLVLRTAEESLSTEELGEAIADYVRAFDAALKAYFYNLADQAAAVREIEQIYRAYLHNSKVVL